MGKAKPTLTAFAEAHKPKKGPPCSICILPAAVLLDIHKGIASGIPLTTIRSWLREIGHVVGPHTLGHHSREGHGSR